MELVNNPKKIIEKIGDLLSIELLLVLTISTVVLAFVNISLVFGAEFASYGSIGQEDQIYAVDKNGLYYVNTGINYGTGNGSFEQINEINNSFTMNGAIKVFGIHEDTEAFIYEPILSNGKYSNVLFMYEFDGYDFELTNIYEDKSGLDQQLTQLENNQ